jgi:hypothetical protein
MPAAGRSSEAGASAAADVCRAGVPGKSDDGVSELHQNQARDKRDRPQGGAELDAGMRCDRAPSESQAGHLIRPQIPPRRGTEVAQICRRPSVRRDRATDRFQALAKDRRGDADPRDDELRQSGRTDGRSAVPCRTQRHAGNRLLGLANDIDGLAIGTGRARLRVMLWYARGGWREPIGKRFPAVRFERIDFARHVAPCPTSDATCCRTSRPTRTGAAPPCRKVSTIQRMYGGSMAPTQPT